MNFGTYQMPPVVAKMAKKPGLVIPKKWIIILAVVVVIAIVGLLLATYKPPELGLDVKMSRDGAKLKLTLFYTSKENNITAGEYRVRVDVRRVVDTTQTKITVVNVELPGIAAQSSANQTFSFEVEGYTDLDVYILRGSKQVIFNTQRIPLV
mgnify:CR=1 FL=1